jgi:hypothetical protein
MDAEFWQEVAGGVVALLFVAGMLVWLVWPRVMPPLCDERMCDEHEDAGVG